MGTSHESVETYLMSSSYIWFRWHSRHSSGTSSWEYIEIEIPSKFRTTKDREKYVLDEIVATDGWGRTNTGSEHFRGFTVELVRKPPSSVLHNEIERQQRRMTDASQALTRARKRLGVKA